MNPLAVPPDLLRTVTILRALDEGELDDFHRLLTMQEVPAGTCIIKEGGLVEHLYILCSGTVHVRRLAKQRELLMGRLAPGAFFGEINFFDPGTATASIYAMTRTQVAQVEYGTLRAFMESQPAAGYKIVSRMMTEMASRFRQNSARLVHTLYWSSAGATQAEEA